jgi:hypothetical protein
MVGGEVVMCSKLKLDDDEGFGYGGGDYIGGCGGGVLRAAGWAMGCVSATNTSRALHSMKTGAGSGRRGRWLLRPRKSMGS